MLSFLYFSKLVDWPGDVLPVVLESLLQAATAYTFQRHFFCGVFLQHCAP
ncbi:hypothetical protein QWZ08_12990 [Ferruginibacter paludis]|nr:hypothetical protein [Ferruginibacter paludis]MDN3656554.1 hypothetical protein [Ferruginibacter paludis]